MNNNSDEPINVPRDKVYSEDVHETVKDVDDEDYLSFLDQMLDIDQMLEQWHSLRNKEKPKKFNK